MSALVLFWWVIEPASAEPVRVGEATLIGANASQTKVYKLAVVPLLRCGLDVPENGRLLVFRA